MTAYEMRIRDWSSDVCSSDLGSQARRCKRRARRRDRRPERRDGKGRSHRPSRASAIASAAAWREHRGTRSPRGAYRSDDDAPETMRSEEHTSEIQSLMRISYAVFCLKKKKTINTQQVIIRETNRIRNKKTTRQTNKHTSSKRTI